MPAHQSEAIVLCTYPLKESDLVVSFFTRDQGKLRGVARRARRPRSNFGAGLERLSEVRMAYFQRDGQELVNLDSCDLIRSQFALLQDFEAGVALDYMAEISEQLLPPAEPNERHYRLLVAVLDHIRAGAQAPLNAEMNREAAGPVPTSSPAGEGNVWRAVTYFTLWAVRLAGFLPQPEDLRGVSEESRRIAAEMLRRPVAEVAPAAWTRRTASDLRRFLVRQIESHIERKLLAAKALEAA